MVQLRLFQIFHRRPKRTGHDPEWPRSRQKIKKTSRSFLRPRIWIPRRYSGGMPASVPRTKSKSRNLSMPQSSEISLALFWPLKMRSSRMSLPKTTTLACKTSDLRREEEVGPRRFRAARIVREAQCRNLIFQQKISLKIGNMRG